MVLMNLVVVSRDVLILVVKNAYLTEVGMDKIQIEDYLVGEMDGYRIVVVMDKNRMLDFLEVDNYLIAVVMSGDQVREKL